MYNLASNFMAPNISESDTPTPESQDRAFQGPRYVACWTEDDGLYWCGCGHQTIAAAMECLIPDGRTFIRAWDKGVLRSLNDDELEIFIFELGARALGQGR